MTEVSATETTSVTALQCELRGLFQQTSAHRALVEAMAVVARSYGADYAVMHATLGAQLLSEEWSSTEQPIDDRLRETVTNVMLEAMGSGSARCSRLRIDGDESAVVAAVLYDDDTEQTGAAAMLLRGCDRERAVESLSRFEGLVGFLALLMTGERADEAAKESAARAQAGEVARHPLRLAFGIAADLQNRHGLDSVAVGFVEGSKVRVVAVSNLDDVRAANPGIRRIRAAMEECMDRREPVLHQSQISAFDEEIDDECHLHRQWSASLGGDAVASVPLLSGDAVVAVVSLTRGLPNNLSRADLTTVEAEVRDFGRLVPLTRTANRGLLRHGVEAAAETWRRCVGAGRRKFFVLSTLAAVILAWLAFGTLPFRFTVPSSLSPVDLRVVAVPRDGVLAALYVRPGDAVEADQLLALLDDHDDVLRRNELRATLGSIEAKADRALAERDSGMVRIFEAERRSVLAQIAIAEADIERARVRAPQAGVILEGDLEERLGARVTVGEDLFQVAKLDRMRVVMQIPESLVLDARTAKSAVFSPTARPDDEYQLTELRVAPASTAADGKNVFLTEALTTTKMAALAPGMEGVAYIDGGSRPAWWVLTRRITNWLRLNFWV